IPELPEARRARLVNEFGLSAQDAATLTTDRELGNFFEQAAKLAKSPKRVASILLSEITMRLRAGEITLDKSPVSLDGVVLAADLAESGTISSKQLKQLLDSCFTEGRDFPYIYDRDKPQQITDSSALEKMIDEVIAANPPQVAQFKGGKRTVSAFFVGQVMRLSKGQANPALLNELVIKKLHAA
ncbi:MAG TPA: hypothetical protein VLI45_04905, partial [Acidobacteriaceae bacterium]|nr:hypothetical protein [Acidobacteriaceae bacterium]